MTCRLRVVAFAAVLLSACGGPDPATACVDWIRAGCEYLERCGQISGVDACVAYYTTGDPSVRLCPDTLATDPYCSDLGDDFVRCADAVKAASCDATDPLGCTLYTSSRSQCALKNWTQAPPP